MVTIWQEMADSAAAWIVGEERWPSAPPPPALPPKFTPLQSILDAAIASDTKKFADLRVVVLNFGHPGSPHAPPTCAMRNEKVTDEVGSAAKVTILYAAFQLKADLQRVLARVARDIAPRPPTLADLRAPLAEYWRTIVPLKAIPVPDLAVLFDAPTQDLNGDWVIDFAGAFMTGYVPNWTSDPARQALIDKLGTAHQREYDYGDLRDAAAIASAKADRTGAAADRSAAATAERAKLPGLQAWYAQVLALTFAERLWVTSRWSDNLGATQCAVDLALMPADADGNTRPARLRYIQAVLKEAGLGSANAGLWLNKAYQEPPRPPRPPNINMWSDPGGGQLGDARSLARLLWSMADGTLISQDDSDAMLRLLQMPEPHSPAVYFQDHVDGQRHQVNWTRSPIAKGIQDAAPRRVVYCASKIGILGSNIGDLAVIKCDIGGTIYRFAIVVMNGHELPEPPGWTEEDSPDTVRRFAEALFGRLILPANQRALGNVP
jgi:hypothetical protein